MSTNVSLPAVDQPGQDHAVRAGRMAGHIAEHTTYNVVKGVAAVAPHVQQGAHLIGGKAMQGVHNAVANREQVGHAMKGAVQVVAPVGRKVGGKIMEGVQIVGEQAVEGANVVVENRAQIAEAVYHVGTVGVGSGVKAVGCLGKLGGSAWNNSFNVIRPFCSQCERALTGGTSRQWKAFTRPCGHLVCPDCHATNVFHQSACIKCSLKPKSRNTEGCFDWLWGRPKPAPIDYFQGYVSTQDVFDTYLPALAHNLAQQCEGLDEAKLLDIMADADSKAQLSMLAMQTSIPIELK